jgi:hypothetical protein
MRHPDEVRLPMSIVSRLLALVLAAAFAVPASAQENGSTLDMFAPEMIAPKLDFENGGAGEALAAPVPNAPGLDGTLAIPPPEQLHNLVLEARLVADAQPLSEGITWRVFEARPGQDGQLALLATAHGGTTTVQLPAGDYLIHAGFGRAGATKRVAIADDDQMESVVLDAGGLKLGAVVGDEEPVSAERLAFEILQQNEDGELVTVIPRATPGRVLRLSAGTYHVISRYGDVNAVVRADIQVEPGKLTEAVMRHTGAEVTLKLVSAEGGEALANTSWTVLTQDGTTVHESIGAFPRIVLAEGSYSAVASHHSEIFSRDFTVEAGVDRDIEVRLADVVQPELEAGNVPEISGTPMQP